MGAIRVTQQLLVQRTLNDLNASLRRLSALQEQLATGLRVNRPSDDPLAARRAVNIRTVIAQQEQFLANIRDASPVLSETDSVLQQVVDILQRTKELTLQGATGTNSQSQLDQIALEIDQLLESLFVAGNHDTNGRFIFGGNRTLAEPFEATRVAGEITAVTHVGNAELIEIPISDGVVVPINVPGSTAFQSNVDVFQLLIDIRDDLRAGDQASLQNVRLDDLDAALEQTLTSAARAGAVTNRTERVEATLEDSIFQFQALLSGKIDADFAETMVNFNAQSNAFQAALNASARVIQPSLLDFLR